MILNKFAVRGRLNLLLVLPVVAVLVVATPLVVSQIDNARSAQRTADAASQARQLGALISELQRELLVTSAYVAVPTSDPSVMLAQQRTVADTAKRTRQSLGSEASDELTAALTRLGSLEELRRNAVIRGVSLDSLARTYHAVTEALIDALRLVPKDSTSKAGADEANTRAVVGLDELLRANEQSALRGTALITSVGSPAAGRKLLNASTSEAQILTQRFVQQADADQAALVVLVDQGEAGRKIDALTRQEPPVGGAASNQVIGDALASAESQASLRRLVQDRLTTQIADTAASRGDAAAVFAAAVGVGVAMLIGLVVALSVIVSRSIANPLRQLTRSATGVADLASAELTRVADSEGAEEQIPKLAEVDVSSGGEVGELASAFNRVQSTAAELLNRQSTNRRNVSLMFANVARRTQNLVHRQLTEVDKLERDEQDPKLLDSLYRLDHLSTRLRRNADKLLVVAGAREETVISGPIDLATALRSALAEIQDYKRVRLGTLCEVKLASPVASDLMLVFAELLENATASSPPESFVELGATLQNDGSCLVLIVDHGVGMTKDRLAEENRRLVERERLDIAPTNTLGLFVVGRLARRHSLRIALVDTPGGGITALVTIPSDCLLSHRVSHPKPMHDTRPELVLGQSAPPTPPALPLASVTLPSPRSSDDSFVWFESDTAVWSDSDTPAADPIFVSTPVVAPAPSPVARAQLALTSQSLQSASTSAFEQPAAGALQAEVAPDAPPPSGQPVNPSRQDLRRRVPGAQLPSTGDTSVHGPIAERLGDGPQAISYDPSAARSTMDDYQSAIARADSRRDQPVEKSLPGNGPADYQQPAVGAMHAPGAPGAPPTSGQQVDPSRQDLRRRVPGAQLPSTGDTSVHGPIAEPLGDGPQAIRYDARTARSTMDDYQSAIARADHRRDQPVENSLPGNGPAECQPMPQSNDHRAGLSRRVPGTHLAPGLLHSQSTGRAEGADTAGQARNADADRLAFEAFEAGLARADASVNPATSSTAADGRETTR